MTIDHDAIAAQLCLNRACREPGPCPDLEAAYLDLYDEVQRLRDENASAMMAGHDLAKDEYREAIREAQAERDALKAERRQWRSQTYTVDEGMRRHLAFETAARQWRETYCLASPGSDEEFHAILSGFDAAVDLARAALKGDSDE